jgi:RNA polymerase sigma-70 factor (ECF subfamily)
MSTPESPTSAAAAVAPQREFVQFFSRHQRQIHAYIGSVLASPDDVEEVLQETSVVLWTKFNTFRQEESFLNWACGVARLQILKFYRTHRRRMLPLDEETMELLLAERTQFEPELSARQSALTECLTRLRVKDQQLVELCYQPKTRHRDVAVSLGRSIDALYHSLGRIRRWLHECIDRTIAAQRRS